MTRTKPKNILATGGICVRVQDMLTIYELTSVRLSNSGEKREAESHKEGCTGCSVSV